MPINDIIPFVNNDSNAIFALKMDTYKNYVSGINNDIKYDIPDTKTFFNDEGKEEIGLFKEGSDTKLTPIELMSHPNLAIRDAYLKSLEKNRSVAEKQGLGFDIITPYKEEGEFFKTNPYRKFLEDDKGYRTDRGGLEGNENYYAQYELDNHNLASRFLRNTGTFLARTATDAAFGAIEGAGYIGKGLYSTIRNIPDIISGEDNYHALAAISDNAFSKWWKEGAESFKQEKGFRSFTPVGYEKMSFFDQFFTEKFWNNDVASGAAFAVQAFIPAGVIGRFGKGAEIFASAAEKGTLNLFQKGVRGLAEISSGTKTWTGLENYAYNLTHESLLEATQTLEETKKDLKTRVERGDIQMSDEEIERTAGEKASFVFKGNLLALSLSNAWENRLMFKTLGKKFTPSTTIGENLTMNAELLASRNTAKSLFGKYVSSQDSHLGFYGKKIAEGFLKEGFYEENIQLAMQREAKEKKDKSGVILNLGNIGERGVEQIIGASRGLAANATPEDREATASIFLGGTIGSGMTIFSSKFKTIGNDNKKFEGERRETKRLESEAVDRLNNYRNSIFALSEVYDKNGKLDETKVKNIADKFKTILGDQDLTEQLQNPLLKKELYFNTFKNYFNEAQKIGLGNNVIERLSNATIPKVISDSFNLDNTQPNSFLQDAISFGKEMIKYQDEVKDKEFDYTTLPEGISINHAKTLNELRKAHIIELKSLGYIYNNLHNQENSKIVDLLSKVNEQNLKNYNKEDDNVTEKNLHNKELLDYLSELGLYNYAQSALKQDNIDPIVKQVLSKIKKPDVNSFKDLKKDSLDSYLIDVNNKDSIDLLNQIDSIRQFTDLYNTKQYLHNESANLLNDITLEDYLKTSKEQLKTLKKEETKQNIEENLPNEQNDNKTIDDLEKVNYEVKPIDIFTGEGSEKEYHVINIETNDIVSKHNTIEEANEALNKITIPKEEIKTAIVENTETSTKEENVGTISVLENDSEDNTEEEPTIQDIVETEEKTTEKKNGALPYETPNKTVSTIVGNEDIFQSLVNINGSALKGQEILANDYELRMNNLITSKTLSRLLKNNSNLELVIQEGTFDDDFEKRFSNKLVKETVDGKEIVKTKEGKIIEKGIIISLIDKNTNKIYKHKGDSVIFSIDEKAFTRKLNKRAQIFKDNNNDPRSIDDIIKFEYKIVNNINTYLAEIEKQLKINSELKFPITLSNISEGKLPYEYNIEVNGKVVKKTPLLVENLLNTDGFVLEVVTTEMVTKGVPFQKGTFIVKINELGEYISVVTLNIKNNKNKEVLKAVDNIFNTEVDKLTNEQKTNIYNFIKEHLYVSKILEGAHIKEIKKNKNSKYIIAVKNNKFVLAKTDPKTGIPAFVSHEELTLNIGYDNFNKNIIQLINEDFLGTTEISAQDYFKNGLGTFYTPLFQKINDKEGILRALPLTPYFTFAPKLKEVTTDAILDSFNASQGIIPELPIISLQNESNTNNEVESTNVTNNNDIEAKKADIERRRREELTKIIQSIFPNTKLNEIVYHGTRTQDKFDTFDETKIGELDSGYFGRGFYFSPDKFYAEGYSKQYNGYTITAILNLQNPLETDANKANTNISLENNDGAIVRVGENLTPELNTTEYNANEIGEVVVKNSNQIHILSEKELNNIDEINAKYDKELNNLIQEDFNNTFSEEIEQTKQETIQLEQDSLPSVDDLPNINLDEIDPLFQITSDQGSFVINEESKKQGEEWFKQNFPQIPVENIEGLIKIQNSNEKALGVFTKSLIKMSSYANKYTYYHEAFHVAFNLFTTKTQQDSILNEASKVFGIERNSKQSLTKFLTEFEAGKDYYNQQTNDVQLEEKLAFGFEQYKKGKENATLNTKILNFFKDLLAKLQSFLTRKENIRNLYNKINNGYFNTKKIFTTSTGVDRMSVYDDKGKELLNPVQAAYFNDFVSNVTYRVFKSDIAQNNGFTVDKLNNIEDAKKIYKNVKTYAQAVLKANPNSSNEKIKHLEIIVANFNSFVDFHINNNNVKMKVREELMNQIENDTEIFDEISQESTAEEKVKKEYDKEGNEYSVYDSLSTNLKNLFNILPKGIYTKDGVKEVIDENNFTIMSDGASLINQLALQMEGEIDEDKFFNKVFSDEMYKIIPELAFLKNLLPDINKLTTLTLEQVNIYNDFFRTFSKPLIPIQIVTTTPIYQNVVFNSQKQGFVLQNADNSEEESVYFSKKEAEKNVKKLGTSYSYKSALTTKYFKIRGEWENNFLISKNVSNYIKRVQGMKYLDSLPKLTEDSSLKDFLEFYDLLGIKFSDNTISQETASIINNGLFLHEFYNKKIEYLGYSQNPIGYVFDKENLDSYENLKNIKAKISELINLEAKYTNKLPSIVFKNSEGENESIISEPNQLTRYKYEINSSINTEDLFNRLPNLNNSFFKNSYTYKELFDKNGNKRKNVFFNIHNYSGLNGIKSSSLEEVDKLKMDFGSLMQNNIIEGPRTESKSSFFAIAIEKKNTNVINDYLSTSSLKNLQGYYNAQKEWMKSEKSDNWGMFDFLSDELKETFNEELFNNEISNKIDEFVKDLENKVLQNFESHNDFLSEVMPYTTENYKDVYRKFIIKNLINDLEYINLFAGNIAYYKAFSKRIAKVASTGMPITNTKATLKFLNNNTNTLASLFGKKPIDISKTINTSTIKDLKIKKESLPREIVSYIEQVYNKYPINTIYKKSNVKLLEERKSLIDNNVADGQAYINLDVYKQMLINRGGVWNNYMETAYNYEILYAKKTLKQATEKELIEFKELEKLIFSDDKYNLPILKFQQSGAIVNTSKPSFDKMSLAPLLPSMIMNGNSKELEKVMIDSVENGIAYIKHKSATKLEYTGDLNLINDIANNITELYTIDLKEQIKTSNDKDTTVILGSQFRKLLFTSLFSEGEAIHPEIKQLYDNYKKTLKDNLDYNKQELFDNLGIEFDGENVSIKDKSKFIKQLQKEVNTRDLNINVKEALKLDKDNNLVNNFEFTGNTQIVNDLLFGLIDKALRVQKVNGGQYTLLANAYFKDLGFYEIEKNKIDDNLSIKHAEVRISLTGDFKKLLNKPDEEFDNQPIGTLERLNELLKNDKWVEKNKKSLTIIAYRIPTQEQNSMEVLRIKEFLTPTAGYTIQAYNEITSKSGADFDIDKLFLVSPSFYETGEYIDSTLIFNNETYDVNTSKEVYKKLRKQQRIYKKDLTKAFKIEIKNDLNILYEEIKKNKSNNKNLKDYKNNLKTYIDIVKNDIELLTNDYNQLIDKTENRKTTQEEDNIFDTIDYQLKEGNKLLSEAFADLETLSEEISNNYNIINQNNDSISETKDTLFTDFFNFSEELFQDFKKLLAFQNAKKEILNNNLQDALIQILSHPLQYEKLTKPNNSNIIENLAKQNGKDLKLVTDSSFDEDGKLIMPQGFDILGYGLGKLDIFKIMMQGKKHLGVYAVGNTFLAISQIGEFKLNTSGLYFPILTQEEKETLIKDNQINLNTLFDAEGNNKNELLAEFITSTVDSPSNPFYSLLGINYDNISTVNYLLLVGVPINRIIDLINTGIVRRYNVLVQRGLDKQLILKQLNDSYSYTDENGDVLLLDNINLNDVEYSSELHQLKLNQFNIENKNSSIYKKQSLEVLKSYLHFEKLGNEIREFSQNYNNDTHKISNIYDAEGKNLQEKILYKKESSPKISLFTTKTIEDISKNSIVSLFNNNKLITKLSKELLPFLTDEDTLSYFSNVIKNTYVSANLKRTLPKVLLQDFMQYIIENYNEEFSSKGYNLRTSTSENSSNLFIAKYLDFKEKYPNSFKKLSERYTIFEKIIPEQIKDGKNLTTLNYPIKLNISTEDITSQQNVIIKELNSLIEFTGFTGKPIKELEGKEIREQFNTDVKELTNDFIALSFKQGGFSKNRFNHSTLLPLKVLIPEFKKAFENYNLLDKKQKIEIVKDFYSKFLTFYPAYSKSKNKKNIIGIKDYSSYEKLEEGEDTPSKCAV